MSLLTCYIVAGILGLIAGFSRVSHGFLSPLIAFIGTLLSLALAVYVFFAFSILYALGSLGISFIVSLIAGIIFARR